MVWAKYNKIKRKKYLNEKIKKKQSKLSPEEFKRLKEINEKQRIRNEMIQKRKNEIISNGGIKADFNDLLGIYNLQFWLNSVNFFGELLKQKIQNIFNGKFIKEKKKNKFWYKNIFIKYDIPKEICQWVIKDENSEILNLN